MRKWMLAICIVLVVPSWKVFGQPVELPPAPKPDPTPAAARAVMERFGRTEATAKKAYADAVAKAAATAQQELARIQEQETKAGHLEAALAVKAMVDKLPKADDSPAEIPKAYSDLAERIEAGITYAEWKGLPGTKFIVEAATSNNLTKIVLKKGDAYLIAPNPTDKWKGSGPSVPVTYLGENTSAIGMRLQVKVGDEPMKGFIAEGEGVLSMRANDTVPADNGGSVTVKIIRIR
jgi:hypothetical protein